MNEQENDRNLEKIKNMLKDKESRILESQEKMNELESKKRKLERKQVSIKKGLKFKLSAILFYLVYNIVIFLLLVSYIVPFINIFNVVSGLQKTLCIISLYVGLTAISTLGAYFAAKVETKLRRKANTRYLEISSQIEEKQQEIIQEKELQKLLKKEITSTLEKLDISSSNETEMMHDEPTIIQKNEENINIYPGNKKAYAKRKKYPDHN